jgi:putative sigma-54 modulation protein
MTGSRTGGTMNVEIKTVHFSIGDDTKEYVHKKLHRIEYAQDLIVDLLFTFTKEKRDYRLEVNLNFKWNVTSHIKVKAFDLIEGVDLLMDKLERKVRREKEKVQDHSA